MVKKPAIAQFLPHMYIKGRVAIITPIPEPANPKPTTIPPNRKTNSTRPTQFPLHRATTTIAKLREPVSDLSFEPVSEPVSDLSFGHASYLFDKYQNANLANSTS